MRIETHAHSCYSNIRLLDSINKTENLITTAHDIGLKGICLTDHEALCGAIEFLNNEKSLKEKNRISQDFKCGIGNEIYLTDTRDKAQKYYHFILIAKDEIGFRQLCELSSKSWYNSYYDRGMERVPTLKSELREIISKNKGHVIATSACLGGQLPTLLLQMKVKDPSAKDKIVEFINFCLDIFGDDFYFEVAPGLSEEQKYVNSKIIQLSHSFGVKVIYGTDAHYLRKEDRMVHKAYLNSKEGEREIDSFYEFAHLMSEAEAKEILLESCPPEEIDKMCENSMEIYNNITGYKGIFRNPIIPRVEVKNYPIVDKRTGKTTIDTLFGSSNEQERYWVNECWNKLEEKNLVNEKYISRLETEADIIKTIGEKLGNCLFEYFNTFQHFVELFWECGSLNGPGRGSSTCFLSNYLLGITQLDPIEWGLMEWRFLNKERLELPDIDTDLSPSKRPLIFKKIREQRGELRLLQVATFGTEGTKSAILSACFKKGTLVETLQGEKKIEDIQEGDYVKTKDGYERVDALTISYGKPELYVKTKNYVNEGFFCTPDHEILTIKSYRRTEGTPLSKELFEKYFPGYEKNETYQRNFKEVNPVWKKAKDIKKEDYGLVEIDCDITNKDTYHWKNDFKGKFGIGISENIKIDEDFCELVGIWLAEGGINKCANTITFTIHKKETLLKNRIISLMWKVFQIDNVSIIERKTSQALTIAYSSSQLAQFFFQLFDNTGVWKEKRADNTYHYLTQWDKKIPKLLMKIDPYLQLQIVKGWFLGDGYARKRGNGSSRTAKITTVSKQLAKDMITIFHRNFINPSVDIESRNLTSDNLCDCYNITLYGEYGDIFYNLKYPEMSLEDYSRPLTIEAKARRMIDIPVYFNGKLYMKSKLDIKIEKEDEQLVYCLMMPNQNFSVNNVVVHNCRGYRSAEYPSGIDVDEAQYIAGLVPCERGFLWTLDEVMNGNEDKDRKPIKEFINEVNKFPGLVDIMLGIEGLVNKRSQHASGVIIYNEDPWNTGAVMRSPNGSLTTQFSLHEAEQLGDTKFDFLVTEICDKIVNCINLLQKDKLIDPSLSLKEVYLKYLHPSVINLKDDKIWYALNNQEIVSLFQFNTDCGGQAIRMINPTTPMELVMANALMRLVGEKGKERPLDRYVRLKNDINQWYDECRNSGLTEDEIKYIEPYYLPACGCPTTQERLMQLCMDKNVANFTLAEANKARKVCAKKLLKEIPSLKEKFITSCPTNNLGEYVWKTAIAPQMSYAFAEPHALAYSFVAIQILILVTTFPIIYWNCACLIVDSSGVDDNEEIEQDEVVSIFEEEDTENYEYIDSPDRKTKVKRAKKATNYGKIATAIGKFRAIGINILPPDINKSSYTFAPDVETNSITYGLKGIAGVSEDLIKDIISNRPFTSFDDFNNRVKTNKRQMPNLIKSGIFDNIENCSREELMKKYILSVCDQKQRLTLQNMAMLINYDMIPDDMALYAKMFSFNKFLKKNKNGNYYMLNGTPAVSFITNHFGDDEIIEGNKILQKDWDAMYKKGMEPMRIYLKENGKEMLEKLNNKLFTEEYEKYGDGNISKWEMDSISFYYHDHELKNINFDIDNFFDLPEDPIIERTFSTKNGQEIKIFKLSLIAGTVVEKNKLKNTISLLTPTGVVNVKIYKNQYSLFDKQISVKGEDGHKKVIEKSWFSKGTLLLLQGFRRGNDYVLKKYKDSIYPVVSKITSVGEDGRITLQYEREEV